MAKTGSGGVLRGIFDNGISPQKNCEKFIESKEEDKFGSKNLKIFEMK